MVGRIGNAVRGGEDWECCEWWGGLGMLFSYAFHSTLFDLCWQCNCEVFVLCQSVVIK